MAQLNFGGVTETVVIRDEFPLEKAREVLKDETIAVIGYGVQGPGQSLNLRDNGFNVIVGQRPGKTYEKAVADGWVPGETLFGIEEACQKASIIMCLLSDAAVMSVWPTIKPCLTPGNVFRLIPHASSIILNFIFIFPVYISFLLLPRFRMVLHSRPQNSGLKNHRLILFNLSLVSEPALQPFLRFFHACFSGNAAHRLRFLRRYARSPVIKQRRKSIAGIRVSHFCRKFQKAHPFVFITFTAFTEKIHHCKLPGRSAVPELGSFANRRKRFIPIPVGDKSHAFVIFHFCFLFGFVSVFSEQTNCHVFPPNKTAECFSR